MWSRHSRRTLPRRRSQSDFINGARTAVLTTRMKLLSGPAFARLARHSDMYDLLRVHIDDEQREERSKVAGADRMVAQKRPPVLAVGRWTYAGHVTLDRSLRDTNSELQKLASDSFGTPGPVVDRHAVDELDGAHGKSGIAARGGGLRSMRPEQPEPFTVPAKDGLGLHEQYSALPVGQNTCEEHNQAALPPQKHGPPHAARRDD